MAEVAATKIGTAIATEAAHQAITKLLARLYEDLHLAWVFKDHLETIKSKLLYIKAILEDASKGNHNNEKSQLVNLWLVKVKDAAFLGDNVMDEYAYEILRRKQALRNRFSKRVRDFFSRSNPMAFHFQMSYKVGKVLSKLNELEEEAQMIGLQQVKAAVDALTSSFTCNDDNDFNLYQVRKHASVSDSEFVGRKYDEQLLLEKLCNPISNEREDISILAILGIGGLGKTTLARRLYNSEKVGGHFAEKKAWICVSENFDVERILKEVVESLTTHSCDLSNTGAIRARLQKVLRRDRYLLVLDDVWNNNQGLWDSLRNELQNIGGVVGSRILITTRSHGVVEKARVVYTCKLEGLSREDSWALFNEVVSVRGSLSNMSLLVDVGGRIVEKCKGVPLAIKVIGGLLQSKEHLSEWESVERSEIWVLPQDGQNYILPSLLLSFNHLPYLSLKQCFAYCAIFPKDSLIGKCELIALWLAQGFLDVVETSNSALTAEDIGDKYINMLLSNSLLHEEYEDQESGDIWHYKMHDLVHDLAVYVSQKDLLVWTAEAKLNEPAFGYQHLIVNFTENGKLPETSEEEMIQRLRTVAIGSGLPQWNFLICARYMHTLIMANVGLREVSPSIGELKHLRYLDLSYNAIKALPESITELYQLQTMIILGCRELKHLPRELHKLVHLRHILTSSKICASKGLQRLTCLQTLPHLELCEGGWTIDELEPLNKVKGHICIWGLEHVKSMEEARKAGLWSKDKVLKLSLNWGVTPFWAWYNPETTKGVLEGLEPHQSITSLELCNFRGTEFPPWIMTMSVKQGGNPTPLISLTKIMLESCRCRQLPTLGQLPLLKVLRLKQLTHVERIDKEFYLSDHDLANYQSRNSIETAADNHLVPSVVLFPALRVLEISNFQRLLKWMPPPMILEAAAFPNLVTLRVDSCCRLDTIPASNIQSLKSLYINYLAGTQSLDIIKYNNSLTSLEVFGMPELIHLPQELSHCTNLQKLQIYGCRKLSLLPTGMHSLIFLETLEVTVCPALESLPDDLFHGLSSLRKLIISDCANLRRIPVSLQGCTSLEYLDIHNCPLIEDPVPDISKLEGLVTLYLFNSGKLLAFAVQSIPLHFLLKLNVGDFSNNEEYKQYLSNMAGRS